MSLRAKVTRTALLVAVCTGLSTPALAQGSKSYGRFEDWKISEQDGSCFAIGDVNGDMVVLGQMPSRSVAGFSIISGSLTPHIGKEMSNLSISFNGDTPATINAKIVAANGPLEPSMMASYPIEIFAAQIAKPVEITLSVDGKQAWRGKVSLSDKALAALAQCKSEMKAP